MTAASPTAAASSTSLHRLLEQRAGAAEISAYLDALSPSARVDEVLGIKGRGVKHLYETCASAAPLTVDDILPASATGTRIYEGRNSLPTFSRFQKRFTRLSTGQIIGYNHQTMAFVTGPGYFAVKPAQGSGEHATEPYFDYTEAPASEPPGWPAFKPNDAGLSRLVYANMFDYMRRVARGVLVGKAYKNGVAQDAYFSLSYAG
jgi:hypothetical protein